MFLITHHMLGGSAFLYLILDVIYISYNYITISKM